AARYFSQAHLYLKGTSWLTSVWPLMMRLSAASTRRAAAGEIVKGVCGRGEESTSRFGVNEPLCDAGDMGLSSSSQVNISFPMRGLCETVPRNAKCPFTSRPDCVAQLHRVSVRERRHFAIFIDMPRSPDRRWRRT